MLFLWGLVKVFFISSFFYLVFHPKLLLKFYDFFLTQYATTRFLCPSTCLIQKHMVCFTWLQLPSTSLPWLSKILCLVRKSTFSFGKILFLSWFMILLRPNTTNSLCCNTYYTPILLSYCVHIWGHFVSPGCNQSVWNFLQNNMRLVGFLVFRKRCSWVQCY